MLFFACYLSGWIEYTMHIQLTKIMTPFLEVTSQQFSSLLTRRSTIVLFLVSKLRARQRKHLTSSKNTSKLMLGGPIGHWPLAKNLWRDIPVYSFSTFGNVRNNSVTSQHGGLEISSSGLELAWKSVVFRVFPAVFSRLFVTQQRRRNGRRLVHKVMNNAFEMLEKARFVLWC